MSRRSPQGSGAGPKPRVLLVDDHRDLLDGVSAMLAADFEIAGVATDGRQGLETAHAAAPDLIVLDINMPRMDGFEAMRALSARGSQVPVVFLSMLDDEDTVAEAFRIGGRGYVLKSRLSSDLATALEQVRHGRLFAPSLAAMFRLAGGPGAAHAMQIYGRQSSFLDGLAAFFDAALRRGDATCAIADAGIRHGLETRLRDRGWNAGGVLGHQRYISVDAADALRRCMRGGRPDAAVLATIAAELEQYRAAVTDGGHGRLAIFGTMVLPLCAAGHVDAAMEIERLWSSITHDLPFFTLCGYDDACFHDGADGLFARACAEHWAVSQTQ